MKRDRQSNGNSSNRNSSNSNLSRGNPEELSIQRLFPREQNRQPAALGSEQIEHYEATGYLILRNVFQADEIAALASEAVTLFGRADLIDQANLRCRWQDHRETGECMFDCFDPVIDIGPVCRFLARDERIVSVLRAIHGDEPCLIKDKLIFKRPGAQGYGLHQDYIAWPEFPRSFISVILPIDSTDSENGATEVFPGYHKQGYLAAGDGDYHELPPWAVDEARGVVLALEPGDLALFGAFTPHRSSANKSTRWRRQLYLSYNAAREGGQQRDAHYRQFQQWLRTKYAEHGRHDVYFR